MVWGGFDLVVIILFLILANYINNKNNIRKRGGKKNSMGEFEKLTHIYN